MLTRNVLFDARLDDCVPVGYQAPEYNISFSIEETERRTSASVYVHSNTDTSVRSRRYTANNSRGSVQAISRWGNTVVPLQRERTTRPRRLDNDETRAFVEGILSMGAV